MKTRTVRELGGEIWSELRGIEGVDWEDLNQAVDVIMGVLARHAGTTIMNDSDLPVAPLPTEKVTRGH
jgi:hypothetical protein